MDSNEQFRKNNELFGLFMQEVLDDPDLLDNIPEGADIVFLPDIDPELREANLSLGESRQREGARVVYIRIQMVPEVRTVFVPRLVVEKVA
jgi:hypothetical protein